MSMTSAVEPRESPEIRYIPSRVKTEKIERCWKNLVITSLKVLTRGFGILGKLFSLTKRLQTQDVTA